jgi:hypothetical protein
VDGLSASIVSFAKFFSLPLKPALLANIRRQSVSGSSGSGTPHTGKDPGPVSREALSFACTAALGKGVELGAESLVRYARTISGQELPPKPAGQDGGAGENPENGRGPADNKSPAEGGTGQGSGGEGRGSPGGDRSRSGNPEALRKLALEAEAGEPLLGLLNRLPGRDGKRWLVIPIPLGDDKIRLRAILRLLLSPSAGTPGDVEQMSLEINGDRRRWLFNCRPGSILQAALWPEPGEKERAGLEQELAASLGLSPGQVKISGWDPLFAPDCRNDLFSLREEV